jgi:plasmid stability protein
MAGQVRWIEKIPRTEDPVPSRVAPTRYSAYADPITAAPVPMNLQSAGNQAIQQLLRSGVIQAKLSISQPNDDEEQDADQIADRIVSSAPIERIRSKCSACASGTTCSTCQEGERIQAKKLGPHTSNVATTISQAALFKNGGQPLPPTVRAFFESRFDRDLSQVRLHTDTQASGAAQSLQARAFTIGQHVAFGAGEFAPQSRVGQHLLAHELAHVVRQSTGMPGKSVQRQILTPLGAGGVLAGTLERGRQRVLPVASSGGEMPLDPALTQSAQQRADQVYQSLQGINDTPAALAALTVQSSDLRGTIQLLFKNDRHQSLPSYLKEQLDGDDLVNAFALLRSPSLNEQHTAMARALIPAGTRDEEVFRILYGLPLAQRAELERVYNDTFGRHGCGDEDYIGTGSLKDDLKGDLSGWRRQKSLALLHRNLTTADELYFDSTGITGTHTDRVISHIQSTWQRGPAAFAQLEDEWNRLVRNQDNWTDETWTNLPLDVAMRLELSSADVEQFLVRSVGPLPIVGQAAVAVQATWGHRESEAWEIVRAVLEGYRVYRLLTDREAGRTLNLQEFIAYQNVISPLLGEEQQFRREEIELRVARVTFTAATSGGFTGLGTNTAQVNRAMETIRTVWERRIARAEREATGEGRDREAARVRRDQYRARWTEEQRDLLSHSEFDPDSADYVRARLTMLGELNLADQAYLASQARDYGEVIRLVTSFWAQGLMHQFLVEAAQPHRAPAPAGGGEGEVLRPQIYNIYALVRVTNTDEHERLTRITDPEYTDVGRGAYRLRYELNRGNGESELRDAYNFLTTPRLSPELRNRVIELYATWYLQNVPGANAQERFLTYISRDFETTVTVHDFRDLLTPAHDPAEFARRAEARYATVHSGVFGDQSARGGDPPDAIGALSPAPTLLDPGTWVALYDLISAEDTEQVTGESMARLNYIAERARVRPEDLRVMLTIAGTLSPESLASLEYESFRSRLSEVRELRHAVTEAMATAVQLAIEAVATVITGGAAAPMLIASLAAAVAAIAVREAALGSDYEALSRENAQQLLLIVVSHSFGSLSRSLIHLSPEQLQSLTRVQSFFVEAAQEGVGQVGTQLVSAAFDDQIPSTESIAARALVILGSAGGAGLRSSLARGLTERSTDVARLRGLVVGHIADQVVRANTEEAAGFLREGADVLSGPEIASRMLRGTSIAALRGVTSGLGEFGSQVRSRAAAAHRDLEQEADEVARRHDAGPEAVGAPPAAAVRATGLIDAVAVNPAHTVSVRRLLNGLIRVTICSPGCAQTRALLESIRDAPAFAAERANILRGLELVDQIERQYGDEPEDPVARNSLEELARRANQILSRSGDEAVFGTRSPAPAEEPAAPAAVTRAPFPLRGGGTIELPVIPPDADREQIKLLAGQIFAALQPHIPSLMGRIEDPDTGRIIQAKRTTRLAERRNEFIERYLSGERVNTQTGHMLLAESTPRTRFIFPEDAEPGVVVRRLLQPRGGDEGADQESVSSFAGYFAALRRAGLVHGEAEIAAALRTGPAGERAGDLRVAFQDRSEDSVRHDLKLYFRSRLLSAMVTPGHELLQPICERLQLDINNRAHYERARHVLMLEITSLLASSDKGNLAEDWYARISGVAASARHVAVMRDVTRLAGFELRSDRAADAIQGRTLIEYKTVSGPLSVADRQQFGDFIRLVGITIPGREAGSSHTIADVRYVLSVPEGVRANAQFMHQSLALYDNLSFVIYNSRGESITVTRANRSVLAAESLLPWLALPAAAAAPQ